MKGIFCGSCMTIRSLDHRDHNLVRCECGNLSGWWTDGSMGLAMFCADNGDKSLGFVIEWSNVYLVGVTRGNMSKDMASLRELHAMATNPENNTTSAADVAAESRRLGFHKDAINCWSYIKRPGDADNRWATDEDLAELVKKMKGVEHGQCS